MVAIALYNGQMEFEAVVVGSGPIPPNPGEFMSSVRLGEHHSTIGHAFSKALLPHLLGPAAVGSLTGVLAAPQIGIAAAAAVAYLVLAVGEIGAALWVELLG